MLRQQGSTRSKAGNRGAVALETPPANLPKKASTPVGPGRSASPSQRNGRFEEFLNVLDAVAAGDLSHRVTGSYTGDLAFLEQGLNRALEAADKRTARSRSAAEYQERALKSLLANLKGLAGGSLEFDTRLEAADESTSGARAVFEELNQVLVSAGDALRHLIADTDVLSRAAVEGKLATRADASRHKGDYRKIVEGVNSTLDAVIGPLNVSARYVDLISRGEIPAKITDNYNGDFNTIKINLNNCIQNINALVADANLLAKAAIEGKLATRADAARHGGDYRKIVEGVNSTLDAVIGPLNVSARYVDLISRGEIPAKITDNYNGDFNTIKINLNNCIENINALVADANLLAKAAMEGKLATRADASKHGGDYRKIVEGVNSTLDAVIGPLNVSARYVDLISRGDIPAKITDNYNGDFNTIKINLNNCIDNINALVADANLLAKAAVEGKLATRADATRHSGDYRKIVEGVNSTLDAVIGPLNVSARYVDLISRGDIPAKITDTYNGDFNTIKINLNNCIDNINALVADSNLLAKAAVEGKLATRADASRHGGDYRKIVEGVNSTLDAVIGPLNVSARYVDLISRGDIPAKITDTYNGDFNTIKINLNNCIENINNLVADSNLLAKAAVEGKLATRADATRHSGDYRKIVEGVNSTLDAVIGPLNVSARYVDLISRGDIPAKITDSYNGDFNTIKINLNNCIENINALVSDTNLLVKAAVEGRLGTRADATKHGGDFRKIVEGVNSTLDAVTMPINEAAKVLERVATQDLTSRVTGEYKGDHAAIKNSINTMVGDLRESITNISQNAESLGAASEELTATSQQMAGNADEASHQANVVSTASEQVTQNVSTVATGAEEMLASIREIAKSANEAARVAKNAVGVADTASQTISKLGNSSVEIGNVIKVITSIAQQTNLLALNATIEAARAGEAGKGVRRGRQRSQGTRQTDSQGDRRHQPQDRGHSGRHQIDGGGDRRDQLDYQPDQRHRQYHSVRCRRADRYHQRDQPQRRRSRQGLF